MAAGNYTFYFLPFYSGSDRASMTLGTFLRRVFLTVVGLFGFCFCLTCLYHAMRGVMKLGGFVASGGPYHIAHQAPDWIWLFPVSIICAVIFIFVNQYNARRVGGVNLMTMLFPAVFLTLGWNFLQFGLKPPGNQPGIAMGWLICAGCFILMGLIPFLFLINNVFKILTGKLQLQAKKDYSQFYNQDQGSEAGSGYSGAGVSFFLILINLSSIVAGIYLGIRYFHLVIK